MKKLAIIGASGHGKVVADIAEKTGYDKIIFLDDAQDKLECTGYPIVGKVEDIINFKNDDIFIAIGNNKVRNEIAKRYEELNFVTLIHPSATISRTVSIGKGTAVMAGVVINTDAKIGEFCIINTGVTVDHDCHLKDFVHISPGSHLAGGVTIGRNSWIGIGSSVIQSLSICEDVIIGAGGVVIKSIDSSGTYVGHPCRKVY
ncbi:acetyltransferase [Streptococcus suis]|nr:acetyltransferase [Streptococcus suis]